MTRIKTIAKIEAAARMGGELRLAGDPRPNGRGTAAGGALGLRATAVSCALGLVVLLGLMSSCSNEGDEGLRGPIEVVPCSQSFLEVEPIGTRAGEGRPIPDSSRKGGEACGETAAGEPQGGTAAWAVTRAGETWTPPTGYILFKDVMSMFEDQQNLVDNTIGIFFSQNGQTSNPAKPGESSLVTPSKPTFGRFFKSSDQWKGTEELKEILEGSGTYYLYGYIPHMSSVTPEISPAAADDNYSTGAVLTLKGLPSVTPSDVCVVIGAKEGKSGDEASYKDNGLRAGDFSYARNNSYVYLLFGHIYSALRFSIKVDETYNALRTIKLKELRMKVLGEGSKAYGKTTVTVTLTANNNGTSPITSVDYSPTLITESASNPYDGEQIFKNDAGKELKASASEFLGHFVPAGMQRFTLVSVYDVYDKNKTATHPEGNLIRKDCVAENTMSLSNEAYRGNLYTVNLTVQPTYLYIMSDPDLDNPTIKLE